MKERRDSGRVTFHIYQYTETVLKQEDVLNIFFGLEGMSEVCVESHRYSVGKGGILLVNPQKRYRIEALRSSLIVLQVPPNVRKAAGGQDGMMYTYACYVKDDEGIQPQFQALREGYAAIFYEYLQNRLTVFGSQSTALTQFLDMLTERFSTFSAKTESREGQAGRARNRREEEDERTAALLQYIDSHWDEELTLSSLAEEMHFSVSYLSRFFQKATGTGFAVYLRKVRMIHARRLLAQGDLSITQISYDCGFRNPSVFIEAFKQEYGITPGQFRQKQIEEETTQAGTKQMRDQRKDFSALLAYLPEKESEEIALRQETWEIDCSGGGPDVSSSESASRPEAKGSDGEDGSGGSDRAPHESAIGVSASPSHFWDRMLNVGYARDCLLADVQAQIRQAQEEIGFTWFRCHGLLDEDMHIYGEDSEGVPFFSFAYMDKLFDFVTGIGLRPYVELSFMPPQIARQQNRIFDRPSVIAGCAEPDKWKALIRAVLEHLAQRYGHAALRSWRFATISLSYVRIGCLSRDDFEHLYEMTYHVVKGFDPELSFGGAGYFPDLTEDQDIGVPWFLAFTAAHGCLPDFHSMQWYPCIRTEDSLFMEYTLSQRAMPALLSRNPDYLREKLDELDRLYHQYHVEGRELFLEECNSTLWQRDLSGDTCFKAVWLAKNITASAGRAVFGYWLLTDLIEERAHIRSVFHGGYGLFTHNGIPKAGYYGLQMLAKLGQKRVAEGDGWILTRKGAGSQGPDRLQLLIYNYNHYSDINCFRYKRLETPEEAYSVFRPGEKLQLHFLLHGLSTIDFYTNQKEEAEAQTGENGHHKEIGDTVGRVPIETEFRITRTLLNREYGSSFDLWIRLQAPPYPGPEETEYLKKYSIPHTRMETRRASDALSFDVSLMPLEMELITIEPVHLL